MSVDWYKSIFKSSALRMFPDYLTDSFEWQGHIPFAFWLVSELKPRRIVELGTYKGDSYLAFCQAVNAFDVQCECNAIDTWEGDAHVGGYGNEVFDSLRAYHDSRYGSFSRLHRMLFQQAVETFSDSSIDILHIDGLHTYEAVRADFELWVSKVSPQGIVLFHDSAVKERGFGVWKLWEELSGEYLSLHFPHSNGLGVLALGDNPPAAIRFFAAAEETEREAFLSFFQILGDRVQSHVQAKFWQSECERCSAENEMLKAKADFTQRIDDLARFISESKSESK